MNSESDKKNIDEKSNQSNSLINKDFDSSLYISKDKNFVFTHQKVKKLAAAVYMITNFFDDHEPMKWSLRSLIAELLKKNITLSDSLFANSKTHREGIRDLMLEIVSLLEVASFAGLVSSMNVDILKKEFTILLEKMDSVNTISGASITNQFFAVSDHYTAPEKELKQSTPEAFAGVISPVQIKDKTHVLHVDEVYVSQEDELHSDQKMKLREFSPVAVKKNKRQSAIINLLKRKKEIMIKDVVGIITDCSEKTIQRELLALVEEGVLKKDGERRWTKYSLV